MTYQFSQVNAASTQGDKPAVDRVQQGLDLVDFQLIKKVDPTEGSLLPIGVPANPESVQNVCRAAPIHYNNAISDGLVDDVIMDGKPYPFTVWVEPDVANIDGVTVSFQPDVNAPFFPWSHGQVTANNTMTFGASVHAIRFQRTTTNAAGNSASKWGIS